MTKRRIVLALAVAGVVLIAVILLASGGGKEEPGSGLRAGNGTDRAFVAAMVPHHQAAVAMAKVAQRRGQSRFVKRLAGAIIRTQTQEITTLRREDAGLKADGVKIGKLGVPRHMRGVDAVPAALETADPFDAEFLKAMIPHHQGAIRMARAEVDKGLRPPLKAVAREIIDAQRRELTQMRKRLAAAGSSGGAGEEGGYGNGHVR